MNRERRPYRGSVTKPKGIIVSSCSVCGSPVRVLRAHSDVACLIAATQKRYADRGWIPLATPQWVELVESAGIPHERGPGGMHLEAREVPAAPHEGPPGTMRVRHVEVPHDVVFAPAIVVDTISALWKVRMPPDFRVRAVRVLWNRDDLPESLETIRRMGGRVMGFLHQLVVHAEGDDARPEP